MDLRKKAKSIAREMYAKDLYPWHVKGELNVRAIPPMFMERLEQATKEELEKMRH